MNILALRRGILSGCLLLILILEVVGCDSFNKRSAAPPPDLITRGRAIYQTQCTACHSSDPSKPGSLGPEVFGSSKELLEARVLRSEYPKDYVPKRPTKTMVAFPHLKNEMDSLHAYLNSQSEK